MRLKTCQYWLVPTEKDHRRMKAMTMSFHQPLRRGRQLKILNHSQFQLQQIICPLHPRPPLLYLQRPEINHQSHQTILSLVYQDIPQSHQPKKPLSNTIPMKMTPLKQWRLTSSRKRTPRPIATSGFASSIAIYSPLLRVSIFELWL